MKHIAAVVVLSAAVPYVAAHGYVAQVSIDGKAYAGNIPNDYQGPSPIRLVSDIGPVKGASNPDLFCGLSAQVAELVVPANPGSAVAFQWSGGDHQKWPHNTGPLMTYMAKCGSTTCDKYNSTDAQWFKIDQAGKKPDDQSQWVQQDVMNGDSYTVTLPQNLPPGDYLIRHEIIALHLAVTMGGAEFYPSCTQVRVGGSGTGSPSNLATFPGAYHDDDPGIYDPNVFDPESPYTFPGPPISNLAAASAGVTPPESQTATFPPEGAATATANGGAARSGSATGATGMASPSASAGTGSSGNSSNGNGGSTSSGTVVSGGSKAQCRLKTSSSATNMNRRRHYSRIMRRILHLS